VPTTSTFAPTSASVDLAALAHNLATIRQCLHPGCDIMAVVKANAYGHGAIEITRTLLRHGIARFAVVSVDEGVALRQAGITAPIVILGPLFPEQIADLLAHQLTPVVSDLGIMPILSDAVRTFKNAYPIHVKVDTGMGRLGLRMRDVESLIQTLPLHGPLQLEGLMTHLSDSDGTDDAATEEQLSVFRRIVRQIEELGLRMPLIHATNSAGLIRFPQSHFSLVRPGIMLYGYHTLPDSVTAPALQPVLSLRTTVAQVRTVDPGGTVSYNRTFVAKRQSRIAVLPVGYADGYNRRLSNRGMVLVNGQRVPVVGLVCMDMMMIDVTAVPHTRVGDEVVLIGRQGQEAIWADEIADWTDTIPYEILCAIGPRVPRIYQAA
jgi:alanine racemase